MKKVIKLAIEGGYEPNYVRTYYRFTKPETSGIECEEFGIALDPSFWRCLGKSLGWTVKLVQHGNWDDMETMTTESEERWKYEMHRFIDHLIEGKPVEEIFTSLIEQK